MQIRTIKNRIKIDKDKYEIDQGRKHEAKINEPIKIRQDKTKSK